jgi:proteasome accessory factor A
MAELMFGVETEYAVAGLSPSGSVSREGILRNLIELARERLVNLPDLHSSGGVFLENGARFYVDCGLHPEICTPECANPWDAVRYILAGHRMLAGLAAAVELSSAPKTEILCFRGNVDYSGTQATWGCHESYLHRIALDALQPQIVPHLVTRLIYTGAGGFNPLSRGLEFTLSPRVAHLELVVSRSSTSERGIWHTKSEPLCSGYSRLHVLCGESLCSETATFLKIGATALIVAMADAGLQPGSAVQLADPLEAMRKIAGDTTCKRPLRMTDGRLMTAIDIQRSYLEMAEAYVSASFMPAWAAEVCRRWRAVLDQLEEAPAAVDKTLDWGIKRALYADHARSLGIRWEDLPYWNDLIDRMVAALAARTGRAAVIPLELAIRPHRRIPKDLAFVEPILQSRGYKPENLRKVLNSRQKFFEIDTRFGQLGPKGIFETLDLAGVLRHRVSGVDNIEHAMKEPPAVGRARIRGQVIKRLAGGNAQCDWQIIVDYGGGQMLDLSDPFTREESWSSMSRQESHDEQLDFGLVNSNDPYSRRQDAADRILSGDYAGAEELLIGLLAEGFMLPSTRCHMARVLLMTNREAEAREQISQAWAIRADASNYVVPRILFFQCIFAIFDRAEITPIVRQIREVLSASSAHLDWTIRPMIDPLRPRLGEANYLFLKALSEVLSDESALPGLEEFVAWRSAATDLIEFAAT